jgi:hypothetical protein
MVGFVVVVIGQYTKHEVVIRLDLSLLSFVSKHNMWTYYGWVCSCCQPSVNTIYGRIMVGLVVANPTIIPPHIVSTDERQQK